MTKTSTRRSAAKPSRNLTHRKRAAAKARPLHKRIALHPFSLMVLLCAGVLIAGSTFRSFADSYSVTATVPAPVITTAATITAPLANEHFSSPAVVVGGGCQAQSYVKLSLNGSEAGVALCQSGGYTIPATLDAGANQLQVQIYNLTDAAGPATPPITAYYDHTAESLPPPTSVPTTLQVAAVEQTAYHSGEVVQSSDNPTITGFAPPYSTVTVTFHSVVSTCVTVADAAGRWSCTLDHTLPIGVHHVDVTATTTDGQVFTFPTFQITVLASLTSILQPLASAAPDIQANYHYQAHRVGQAFRWKLTVDGGRPPFAINIDWGDGISTHQTQADHSTFAISHAYKTPKDYVVTITGVDADGAITRFQVVAVVNNLAGVPAGTVSGGSVGSFLGGIRQRLWLIWPAYIVVVLIVVGYWLGEREEYQQLMARRRTRVPSRSR